MKKTLQIASAALFLSVTSLSAQVLESDNYNSYTLGDVGTNFAFGAPGQGGIYLLNGTAPDYQIVNIDATHGKSLQIISGAGVATTDNRSAVKPGLASAWTGRTSGNNVLNGTLDIYTGTSTGNNYAASVVYGSDNIGIAGIQYNSSTKQLVGLARLKPTSGAAGFYNITFGATAPTFPANTWIKVGYSYDSTAGSISYNLNGTITTLSIAGYTTPAGIAPSQHNISSLWGAANAASTTAAFDNYQITATSTATLGVAGGAIAGEVKLSVYPNPTADYLNIATTEKIQSVEVYDISGKAAKKSQLSGNKIDVRSLLPGSYILKINTDKGTHTEKFIKK